VYRRIGGKNLILASKIMIDKKLFSGIEICKSDLYCDNKDNS